MVVLPTQEHVVVAVAVQIADADEVEYFVARDPCRALVVGHGHPAVHRVVLPAPVLVAEQDLLAAVAVEIADAGDLPVGVGMDPYDPAPGGDVAPAVHRVVPPPPVFVAQQHIVVAVVVEVAGPGQAPAAVAGHDGGTASGCHGGVLDGVVVPAPAPAVPQEDIVRGVAVEIGDRCQLPIGIRVHHEAHAFVRGITAVHGIDVPASVVVAQQDVVVAVAVEIPHPLVAPRPAARQVGGAAQAADPALPVHGVVEPASVFVAAQQDVVVAVAVDVADARRPRCRCRQGNGQAQRRRRMADVFGVRAGILHVAILPLDPARIECPQRSHVKSLARWTFILRRGSHPHVRPRSCGSRAACRGTPWGWRRRRCRWP